MFSSKKQRQASERKDVTLFVTKTILRILVSREGKHPPVERRLYCSITKNASWTINRNGARGAGRGVPDAAVSEEQTELTHYSRGIGVISYLVHINGRPGLSFVPSTRTTRVHFLLLPVLHARFLDCYLLIWKECSRNNHNVQQAYPHPQQ